MIAHRWMMQQRDVVISLTKQKAPTTESKQTTAATTIPTTPNDQNQQQILKMRNAFVFLLSFLVLASTFQVQNTQAASLRNTAIEDENLNFLEQGSRRLAPSGCPDSAIPGICSQCNGDGCSLFRCSAFTSWTCPDGYTACGYEDCLALGFCHQKTWCAPN
jgi:hypothetical protein